MIISLVNQKGGVGKTTLAINLSHCIAERDKKVLLIDADPQGSVLQWSSIAKGGTFDVLHHPNPTFHEDMETLAAGYDHVLIDAPPATGTTTRSILLASNLAIVPIGPSPLDIWSSRLTIQLIKEARKHNKKLIGKLLVCKKITGTRVGRDAKDALQKYRRVIFDTEIGLRVAYVEASIFGQSVLEFAPTSEAANEIRSLCKEIIG